MARVLTCMDAEPAPDGSCVDARYVEQSTWVDYLPTVDQANQVGAVVFTSLMILAVARKLLFPPTERAPQ